jgi:hypothetical protein
MTAFGPSLPNRNVRSDGEFRRESGLVLLTMSFVDFDPQPKSGEDNRPGFCAAVYEASCSKPQNISRSSSGRNELTRIY